MASADQLTEGNALQTYVLLSKNAKAKACTAVIQQALSAPNVFVFGELLEMPTVQQLAGTEDSKYLDLLKIFAYGTYSEYKAKISQLPTLTPLQTKKLQQLSIATLATTNKVIPYSVLQQELDITGLRELEDLIIDAIYQGLIQGKLDQKRKQFEIEFAMGRDLKPESLDEMISLLQNWSGQSENLLKTIKDKIQHGNFMSDQEKKHKEDFEKKVENTKLTLKMAMETEMLQAAEFESAELYGKGGRPGKSKGHRDPHLPQHRDRRGV